MRSQLRSSTAMLGALLDEMLLSEAFLRQSRFSAVDLAQSILKLAAQGERNPQNIKCYIMNILSAQAAA